MSRGAYIPNPFTIACVGEAILDGSQEVIVSKDNLDCLQAIKNTLQAELRFADPSKSIISALLFDASRDSAMSFNGVGSVVFEGHWATLLDPHGSRYIGSGAPTNPIKRAANEHQQTSATVQVRCEANPIANKETAIVEAIARIALTELLGANTPSLLNMCALIQEAKCYAADHPTESLIELLRGPAVSKLQAGLSKEISRTIRNADANTPASPMMVGNAALTTTPNTMAKQLTAAIFPSVYRQQLIHKQAYESGANTPVGGSLQPPSFGGGNNSGNNTLASGSALQAIRTSNNTNNSNAFQAPQQPAEMPSGPTRNKAAQNKASSAAADTAGGSTSESPLLESTQSFNEYTRPNATKQQQQEAPPAAPRQRGPSAKTTPTNGSYYPRDNTTIVNTSAIPRSSSNNGGGMNASNYSAPNTASILPYRANDTITIYCVYNGATSQRAKAVQVSRRNPGYETLMQTLTYKFNAELVLGYIDNTNGECSEVLNNEELTALIEHCDGDCLTLQCWAKHFVRHNADIIDTEIERRLAAADFDYTQQQEEAEVAPPNGGPTRNKSARKAVSSYNNDVVVTSPTKYDINTHPLAPKPAHLENYKQLVGRGGGYDNNASYNNNTNNSAYNNDYSTANTPSRNKSARPTSAILSQAAGKRIQSMQDDYATSPERFNRNQSSSRLTSSALSRNNNNNNNNASSYSNANSRATSPARNKSARPTSARSRGAVSAVSSARNKAVKPSFTPSHRLDVSGTAWNETQLREIFDQFDLDGDGHLDRSELMQYFFTYHDDMGIVDAKKKFVDMLNESVEFKDGKLDFNEFAVVMLRVAQW